MVLSVHLKALCGFHCNNLRGALTLIRAIEVHHPQKYLGVPFPLIGIRGEYLVIWWPGTQALQLWWPSCEWK